MASKKTASTRTSGRSGASSIVDRPVAEHGPEARHGPLEQLGQVEHLEVGAQRARFDPAEVEHRADEPVETLGLGVDRSRRRARTSSLDQPTSGSARFPAVARMLASGVRRSCETESSRALLSASLRRATSALVASPRSRSRRSPSASWSAASDRRRVASGSGGAEPAGLTAQSDPKALPPVSIRDPDEIATRVVWRRSRLRLGERLVGADPARRLVAGRSHERGHDRGRRRRPGARVGQDPLPRAAIEHDPDPLEAGIAGEPFDDRAGDRLGALGRRQEAADGELAGRLDRPAIRLGGTLPTERGEAADGEGDDEDEHEVEQLARVGDREREARLGEQQVVDEERRDAP